MNKKKVLIGMSGGVDSSIAMLKIVEAGYDAIGVTMKLWEYRSFDNTPVNDTYCCSLDAINNAKLVCSKLGVPHYTLDFQEQFKTKVIDYFVDEYKSGRTPNPCIRCNSDVRWTSLLEKADMLDAYWIATGHYARNDHSNGRTTIRKATDPNKDQSYVLWAVSPEELKRTLFPLGDMNKQEVRKIASDAGLVTADISDSQELCFVPDNDYRKLLHSSNGNGSEKGIFKNQEGDELGEHKGITYYTVGQRRGLGLSHKEPLYVRSIEPSDNTVTVAPKKNMFFSSCVLTNINWLVEPELNGGNPVSVLIRYHHNGVNCKIIKLDDGKLRVEFETPQFAVVPGQSAVFYDGDKLLGGGIIQTGEHAEK